MSLPNQESKRLFVAFVIPASVDLASVCNNLRAQINGVLQEFDLTFECTPDFHCTLEFIGEMAAHKMELVKDGLGRAAIDYVTHVKAGPIEGLTIDQGARFMGDSNAISMMINLSQQVHTLVKYIRKHLNALNIPITDHRDFQAHVTLGRVPRKVLSNKKIKDAIEQFAAQVPAPVGAREEQGETFAIKSFFLYHSSDSVYHEVEVYTL